MLAVITKNDKIFQQCIIFNFLTSKTVLKVLFALILVHKYLENLRQKEVLSGNIFLEKVCSIWQKISENANFD